MKQKAARHRLWWIVVITAIAGIVNIPAEIPVKFSLGSVNIDQVIPKPSIDWSFKNIKIQRSLELKKGLDLQGGTRTVLEANMDTVPAEDRDTALESAKAVISRRIDLYGISETVVQTAKTGGAARIIVELPGVDDPSAARSLIGQTAKLEFRELPQDFSLPEEVATNAAQSFYQEIGSMVETDLSGQDLARAVVEFDQTSGEPIVALTFSPDGGKKFGDITSRNVGKKVGIFLDGFPLTVPVVQTAITDGRAIISGGFTTEEAKRLTITLNAGALPVDLSIVSQTQIGATLGNDSVTASIRAGLTGLGIVALFMIVMYRKLGLIANVSLLVYGLLTLALYRLIPITLTLPGIAGFLLSIGMATDANILIFERTREELHRGRPLKSAIEMGFGRAWDSIKDANVATLLTAFILYNPFDWTFLNTSGLVRGFALTLTIGILLSLFTGVVVSRTLIRVFYTEKKQ